MPALLDTSAPADAPVPGVSPAIRSSRIDAIEEMAFVLDFVEKSQQYRRPFMSVWDEIRDNYMVVPFGQSPLNSVEALLGLNRTGANMRGGDRSVLKDPETHQIIETLATQAMLLLLGPTEYLKAAPIGADDPEKARMLQRLLMAFLDAPDQYITHYQIFKNAFMYGTSYVEIGWQHLTRMQPVRRPYVDPETGLILMDPNTGRPIQTVSQEEVIYRDQPHLHEIPLRDFFPDPSGTRIQKDMHGVAKRFRSGRFEAERLRNSGTWNDGGAVQRALTKLDRSSSPSNKDGPREEEFPGLSKIIPEKFGLAWGFTYYGEVPFHRSDGRNRVITLWGGERVAGYPLPFIDGQIPVKEIVVNPVGGRHYGLSPAEVIRFLQDSTDAMLMAFSDAAEIAIRGPLLLGQSFGGSLEQVRASLLNDVIKCKDADAVKPIPRDFGALTFGAAELARRILRMREATGATNPFQAIPGPVEKTATETNELVRLASQRVQSMVELIERDAYPWIGRTLHSRFRQFADADMTAIFRGETFNVTLDDIDVDADIRFVGSQQAESQGQTAAKLEKAITVISAAPPEFVEQYPELFTRYFRDGLRIQDAEQWVARAIQVAQLRAALQQSLGVAGQQPPQEGGGVLSQGTPRGKGAGMSKAEESAKTGKESA